MFRVILLSINAVIFLICSIETAGITNQTPIALYLASSAFIVILYIAFIESLNNSKLSNEVAKARHQELLDTKRYAHLRQFVDRMREAEERLRKYKD